MPYFHLVIPSPFGPVGIVWQDAEERAKVHRIFLSDEQISAQERILSVFPGAFTSSNPTIIELGQGIQRFLDGHDVTFDLNVVTLDGCRDFQRRVILTEYAIPRGWVSTYGRIAKHLGVERGGRAVGRALAENPFPIVIPCHRAIRANGELGGYQGGSKMKRALLELEGMDVSNCGKVITPKLYY